MLVGSFCRNPLFLFGSGSGSGSGTGNGCGVEGNDGFAAVMEMMIWVGSF